MKSNKTMSIEFNLLLTAFESLNTKQKDMFKDKFDSIPVTDSVMVREAFMYIHVLKACFKGE